jgi:cell division initiation protein
MTITPIDIQQHRFKTRPMGYDKAGVDYFLEQLADELERYHLQVQKLKEELARTRESLEEMRQREATLNETLLTTQRMTDELKANARKESDIIVAQAELQAERILRDAEEKRLTLIADIQEIRCQKVSFQASLRAVVESHMRLLELDALPVPEGVRYEPVLMEVEQDDNEQVPRLCADNREGDG